MKFEKLSRRQWGESIVGIDIMDKDGWLGAYDDIKHPKQGTAFSMGMDFFAPYDITLYSGNSEVIPTGIRWVVSRADGDVGLIIVPRSGLGFKHGIRLENTVGIIDADYQFAKNEGHIMIKLHNPSNKTVYISKGAKALGEFPLMEMEICHIGCKSLYMKLRPAVFYNQKENINNAF